MKKLGISLVAVLVGLPVAARADITPITLLGNPAGTVASNTKVATTSYVQGAYNDLAGHINTNVAAINANTTAIAGKQAQLTNGTANVSATVATSVRAAGTADDATLVTEKAVRDAIASAGGQTAQQVEDAIDAAAGAGIATDGSGKLSVDLTSNGGLELTGSGDAATVGVKVDGTHVIKDASGNVTLSTTDINNLTAASTALQAADITTGSTAGTISVDGTDVAVNGVLTDASAFATAAQGATAEATAATVATYGDIVTHNSSEYATATQGALAESALQAADLADYGFAVYGNWATPDTSTGNVTLTDVSGN